MKRGYDRLARHYRALELCLHGRALEAARLECLEHLVKERPSDVLLVGDGDGRFLVALLRRLPHVRAVSVDSSASMLALARSRLSREERRRTRHVLADTTRLALGELARFDALVSHCFLDQFTGAALRGQVTHLARFLRPGATWAIADYRVPAGGLARLRARATLFVLYRVFGALTAIEARELEDPAPVLEATGFRVRSEASFDRGLLASRTFSRDTRAGVMPPAARCRSS